uniref:Putative NADH dehydrogenase n=1 Tax=viral metagenome TaxID=1070528 RepID=A0A6M3IYI8_9ZZZZ
MRILVTGAAGFIASRLIPRLRAEGHWVRGADILRKNVGGVACDDYVLTGLHHSPQDRLFAGGIDRVYHLAALQGGVAFKDKRFLAPAVNNLLVDLNVLTAAMKYGAERILFTSSVCIYPRRHTRRFNALPLRENLAWLGEPEDGYGKAKLMSEDLFSYAFTEHQQSIRIARLENVYGPGVVYEGDRAKAPGEIARKVLEAPDGGEVEVYGDGDQRRQFLYVDDAVDGLVRLMESPICLVVNLAGPEQVSINDLVFIVSEIAGKIVTIKHLPVNQGAHTRSVPTDVARAALKWSPGVGIHAGMRELVLWLRGELADKRDPDGPEPSRMHERIATHADTRG